MVNEEKKIVLDALIKSHVFMRDLPGMVFVTEEGASNARGYFCFACMASSGENHRDDCEVVALSEMLRKARDIAARELQTR